MSQLAVRTIIIAALMSLSAPLPAESDELSKGRWIEKASKTLRHGYGIGPADRFDELKLLPKEQIVERFMNEKRFQDTIVDLMLFYLSRQTDNLKSYKSYEGSEGMLYSYSEGVLDVAQAIYAAQLVYSNDDFFKVYSKNVPLFFEPRGAPERKPIWVGPPWNNQQENGEVIIIESDDDEADGSDEESSGSGSVDEPIDIPDRHREPTPVDQRPEGEILDSYLNNLKKSIRQKMEDVRNAEDTFTLYEIVNALDSDFESFFTSSGFSPLLAQRVRGRWGYLLLGIIFGGGNTDASVAKTKIIDFLRSLYASSDLISAKMRSLPKFEQGELFATDMIPLGGTFGTLPALDESWSVEKFWRPLRNSSTNFNRKRAAYALRTFFCDDLTPISVPMQDGDLTGVHGSDAACASCHYKLDPMGGLFREHGLAGTSFKSEQLFIFDDFKAIDVFAYEDYLDSWKRRDGSWKVGYFVKPDQPHELWQGDDLEDLWDFIRKAPEAKQCFVKRVAEYILGANQVYESAWLEKISQDFQPGPGSGQALKQLIANLVLSNTFAQADPVAGECYDFAAKEEHRPPCAIAHLLDTKCQSCHNSSNASGGLDLSQWLEGEEGNRYFPHIDPATETQRPRSESFQIIIDRLTTSDPLLRMPLSGRLSDPERQTLFHWFDEEMIQ